MKPSRRTPPLSLTLLAVVLAGCATPETAMVPAPLLAPPDVNASSRLVNPAETQAERRLQVTTPPAVPLPERLSSVKGGASTPSKESADLSLSFDGLSLPNFVQVVFGQVLKKTFSLDPTLITRTDLVTLRTSKPMTPSEVLETTRLLLKSYGVAVLDLGGDNYRIVPDNNQAGYLPEIRRGRALPDVPLPMRPVFNLVELTAVRHSEVANWLKSMFGQRLAVQEDPTRNALLISGPPAEITAALEAIQVLDQPLMRGRGSRLVTPGSLSADDLAKRLTEILSAEGYAVATGISQAGAISLVPVPASNAVLVFAQDGGVLSHVVEWAAKLDQLDTGNRRSGNYFSYEVKYADAQALAKTLQELLTGQSQNQTQGQPAPAGATVIGTPRQPARIVVNPSTNTLIVSTTNADDPAQLLSLMRSLDRPTRSVMIEVTVAELSTTDKDQLGIDWILSPQSVAGATMTGGTLGGVAIQSGGLALSFLNSAGSVKARLNALASNNRGRILSAPKVMARNGEAATIQVGEEVPIITSQQSTPTTSTTTGIVQTIQYRTTGVLLKVRPVIFANRVELDVQQEVSTAGATASGGVTITPTFSTRKIDTKVSIRDGATVALGGLIKREKRDIITGVPLLKDIPFAGQLFRSNDASVVETELVVLITPYVVENDVVAEQVTQSLRGQMGEWAQTVVPRTPPAAKFVEPVAPAPSASGTAPSVGRPTEPVAPEPSSGIVVPPQATGAPAPARESSPTAANSAASAASSGAAPGQTAAGAPAPSGKTVTDESLLEELKRATAGGATVQPPASKPAKAVPATKSSTKEKR